LLYYALSSIRRHNDFVITSKRTNWGQYYPRFARFELFGALFAVLGVVKVCHLSVHLLKYNKVSLSASIII
jgi:hypothetical protein